MLKNYYELTKPGIVYGNAITATAGFFLASKNGFNLLQFFAMIIGLSCIVAAGCVLNNYFDRLIDRRMTRTKERPLAKGAISLENAVRFGFGLLFFGIFTLLFFTSLLATLMGLFGFIIYVGFYTIWKYKTVYATEIGSLAGAVPPVVGYTTVAGHMDLAALLLFSVVALWQMPHFFAIAIYRQHEYATASIPVLPIKRGIDITKQQMLIYMGLFFIAALSLSIFTGYVYLISALLLGLYWFSKTFQGIQTESAARWARKVFLSSLVVIIGLCSAIVLDYWLC